MKVKLPNNNCFWMGPHRYLKTAHLGLSLDGSHLVDSWLRLVFVCLFVERNTLKRVLTGDVHHKDLRLWCDNCTGLPRHFEKRPFFHRVSTLYRQNPTATYVLSVRSSSDTCLAVSDTLSDRSLPWYTYDVRTGAASESCNTNPSILTALGLTVSLQIDSKLTLLILK